MLFRSPSKEKKLKGKRTYLGLETQCISSPACPGADVGGRRHGHGGGVGCHGLLLYYGNDDSELEDYRWEQGAPTRVF